MWPQIESTGLTPEQLHACLACGVVPLAARPPRVLSAVPLSLPQKDRLAHRFGLDPAVEFLPQEQFSRLTEDFFSFHRQASGLTVPALAERLLQVAVEQNASDMRVEGMATGYRVRFRLDGRLTTVTLLDREQGEALLACLKVALSMDPADRRSPQDGRSRHLGGMLDLRGSCLPTVEGETLALRLLRRSSVRSLEQLGADEITARGLRRLVQGSGLVLSVGPTGSGKTTTQYALLQLLDREQYNVMTLEDPVEYRLDGVNQILLNDAAGCSFDTALRAVLRQDPDVVVVGEIRDSATARLALRLALTGHLVFSTLHTVDSPSALVRLVDMGCEPYLVAACVKGVVAQRLVRVFSDGLLAGRRGVFELLPLGSELRQALIDRAPLATLRALARAAGVPSLRQSARALVEQGLTTYEEAWAATPEDEE